MLTVSMPTYNVPAKMLQRAVTSVLQRQDMRLVVVNDAGVRPTLPSDPRIVYYELPSNRGRYFCDAVVLAALEDGWWCPHDSDDLSLPYRFKSLPDVPLLAPYIRGRQRKNVKRSGHGWRQIGHWCAGVYPVQQVKGLVHPGFRVGWDTVFLLAVTYEYDVQISKRPSYKHVPRHGSLTTSPDTGRGSLYRHAQTEKLRRLWDRIQHDGLAAIQRDVPKRLRSEVQVHARQLKALL